MKDRVLALYGRDATLKLLLLCLLVNELLLFSNLLEVEGWVVLLKLLERQLVPLDDVLLKQLLAHVKADHDDTWLLERVSNIGSPLLDCARCINDFQAHRQDKFVIIGVEELHADLNVSCLFVRIEFKLGLCGCRVIGVSIILINGFTDTLVQ